MIDLHMHSWFSIDGEFSPGEIVAQCAAAGLSTVALTDHNSVRGVEAAVQAGKERGLQVVPAVELDCVCQGRVIHLLGYGINCGTGQIDALEQTLLAQAGRALQKSMGLLHEMGIAFDEEAVLALGRATKTGVAVTETVAEVAISDARNADNPHITPYLAGGARSDNPCANFYWDLCAQGRPAHVAMDYPSFEWANGLIHELGGVSAIAHPGNTVGQNEEMLAHMAGCAVMGLEVYSSYHTEAQVTYYLELAAHYGLVPTIGSDFHGKYKPAVRLGQVPGRPDREKLRRDFEKMLTYCQ